MNTTQHAELMHANYRRTVAERLTDAIIDAFDYLPTVQALVAVQETKLARLNPHCFIDAVKQVQALINLGVISPR